jgi:hypothetical protein
MLKYKSGTVWTKGIQEKKSLLRIFWKISFGKYAFRLLSFVSVYRAEVYYYTITFPPRVASTCYKELEHNVAVIELVGTYALHFLVHSTVAFIDVNDYSAEILPTQVLCWHVLLQVILVIDIYRDYMFRLLIASFESTPDTFQS